MPDPRRRRGTRHRAAVLAFAVAAVMAGADSVTAIAERAGDLPPEALAALGARRGRLVPPSLSTFRRVLRRLEGQALAAAFGGRLAAQVMAGLLAAMIAGARAVIAQKDVDAKTNEITQARPLLDDVGITGALVAADALHVQRETARYLVQDKGHGRHETRTIQVLPAPEGLFPHAAQAFLIERAVRDPHDGRLRSAVAAPGITSRPPERGRTPQALALAARAHWEIDRGAAPCP